MFNKMWFNYIDLQLQEGFALKLWKLHNEKWTLAKAYNWNFLHGTNQLQQTQVAIYIRPASYTYSYLCCALLRWTRGKSGIRLSNFT